jgi:RNA polymerase II subunit A small phosphatase-like protein
MKSLLVLDIDETLIHATVKELDREPDFKVSYYNIFKRPDLESFLAFAHQYFKIGIWSSAGDDYVVEVVNGIMPSEIQPEFVWGGSKCTIKLDQDSGEYYPLKNAKKLKKLGYDLDRIIMVDDSPEKLQANYGNAVIVAPYFGDEVDHELVLLQSYLLTLKDRKDIRRIEKRNWRQD